jgi:hypothetical protein
LAVGADDLIGGGQIGVRGREGHDEMVSGLQGEGEPVFFPAANREINLGLGLI